MAKKLTEEQKRAEEMMKEIDSKKSEKNSRVEKLKEKLRNRRKSDEEIKGLEFIDLHDFESHFVKVVDKKTSKEGKTYYEIMDLLDNERKLLGSNNQLRFIQEGKSYEIILEKEKVKIDGIKFPMNSYKIFELLD